MKKLFPFITAALVSVAVAADDYAAAEKTVRSIVSELLAQVESEKYKEDEEEFFRLLAENILVSVNTDLMSRLMLGKHWTSATEEQRKRFIAGFKNMLIRSYGKSIVLLSGITIKFLPPAASANGKPRKYQVVHTEVVNSEGRPPISINYSLANQDGTWKVFDLIIDGVSILRQFRQNFRMEIEETGFDALINRLNSIDA